MIDSPGFPSLPSQLFGSLLVLVPTRRKRGTLHSSISLAGSFGCFSCGMMQRRQLRSEHYSFNHRTTSVESRNDSPPNEAQLIFTLHPSSFILSTSSSRCFERQTNTLEDASHYVTASRKGRHRIGNANGS